MANCEFWKALDNTDFRLEKKKRGKGSILTFFNLEKVLAPLQVHIVLWNTLDNVLKPLCHYVLTAIFMEASNCNHQVKVMRQKYNISL